MRPKPHCSNWHSRLLNIVAHGGCVGFDLVDPVLHELADRDEADQMPAVNHRQVADAPPRQQRYRGERTDKRSVGKEWVSEGRYRWSPVNLTKKKTNT